MTRSRHGARGVPCNRDTQERCITYCSHVMCMLGNWVRLGSCTSGTPIPPPSTLLRVCVCVLSGALKGEGATRPREWRSKWAITVLHYLISSALNVQILHERSLCVCPLQRGIQLCPLVLLVGVTVSWWREPAEWQKGEGGGGGLCNAGLGTAARPAPAWLLGGGKWQPAQLQTEQTAFLLTNTFAC